MNIDRFENLVNELFVVNIKLVNDTYVSPLNVDRVTEENRISEIRKKEVEKELYDSLIHVRAAIERDKGISETTYNNHKYAINSLARDLTSQRWWGSALIQNCEKEDREGRKASPEQIARFRDDNSIENGTFNDINIFDEGSKTSSWEGTLFQTDYGKDGNLDTYRIFHQGHRNALKVKTVNVSELIDKIKSYVSEFINEVSEPQFGLTLDKDTYILKMEEFNAEFGNSIKLEIVREGGSANIVARFNENPEILAKMFVELAHANCLEVEVGKGPMTYTVSRYSPDFTSLNLFLQSHLEDPWHSQPFDSEQHRDASTIILPYVSPEFSIQLMKMYVFASMSGDHA